MFNGIVRELIALHLCASLVLIGAVLVMGVPVRPRATWECPSVFERRGSRRAALVWTSSREDSISSHRPELSSTRAY